MTTCAWMQDVFKDIRSETRYGRALRGFLSHGTSAARIRAAGYCAGGQRQTTGVLRSADLEQSHGAPRAWVTG